METYEFEFEDEQIRIRPLADDSGVAKAGLPNRRQWNLERKLGQRWVKDCHVILPNEAGLAEARARFRF